MWGRSAPRADDTRFRGGVEFSRRMVRVLREQDDVTRVSSLIQCRIEPLQFGAGVGSGELPVDLGPDLIAGGLPGGDLIVWDLEGVKVAVEALVGQEISGGVQLIRRQYDPLKNDPLQR